MENFEYKVTDVEVNVTSRDINKEVAGAKVAGQVELKLKEFAQDGWEYYAFIPVSVEIKPGCLGFSWNSPPKLKNIVQIYTMVFRRPLR